MSIFNQKNHPSSLCLPRQRSKNLSRRDWFALAGILATVLAPMIPMLAKESPPPSPIVEVTVNTHQPPATDFQTTTPPALTHRTPPGIQEQAGEV